MDILKKDVIKNPEKKQISYLLYYFYGKIKNINLKNKTLAFNFYEGTKGISLKILILKTPKKRTDGLTSYCSDGKHILMFDYDNKTEKEVLTELKILQGAYCLSDIYVFKNDIKKSFCAFCLDKFTLDDAVNMISQTSADYAHKKAPLIYGLKRWVYRFGSKGDRKPPEYFKTIKHKHNDLRYKKSNAHRIFLNTVFGMKIKKNKTFDNFTEIDIYSYLTGNRIKKGKK